MGYKWDYCWSSLLLKESTNLTVLEGWFNWKTYIFIYNLLNCSCFTYNIKDTEDRYYMYLMSCHIKEILDLFGLSPESKDRIKGETKKEAILCSLQ